MNKIPSKAITGVKYVYLIIFFALLSGFFYPLITGAPADSLILGVFVLFVGLAGCVLIFKAASSDKNKWIFFGIGFGLVAISLFFIFQLTGRV